MYVDTLHSGSEFDFIIVGAGSSGCALAGRLSEDRRKRVLLIEAGRSDNHYKTRIPAMVAHLLNDPQWIWPYVTEPQKYLKGQKTRWIRGRALGGSSSINGMVFVRGDPLEYDKWRDEFGCKDWGWRDMLPIFKRLESYSGGDPSVRGRNGPIHCRSLEGFNELSDAYVKACGEAGHRVGRDLNDGDHYEGAFFGQISTRNGLRSSASRGYIHPFINRPNLTVLLNAHVTKILIGERRALGVEYQKGSEKKRIIAKAEVALAAGPIGSPQLLELSGVGNESILRRLGITVVHHLPGVGENLLDHANSRIAYECTRQITINDMFLNPWNRIKEAVKFALKRDGYLTISASLAQAHVRGSSISTQADIGLRLQPFSGLDRYARTKGVGLDPFSGFNIGVTLLHPKSVGNTHIQTSDPYDFPRMDPQYLIEESDSQRLLNGMRMARNLAVQPALRDFVRREVRPGPTTVSDEDLMDYIRETVQTSWHQVGTCRMGSDKMSVVSPTLRVQGIEGLRVVDSSIFPTIPSANTNIPSIAAGEKASDFISADNS